MKTLLTYLGVGAVAVLLGMGIAKADIQNGALIDPLSFPIGEEGNGYGIENVSFDSTNDETQSTCAMTYGETSSFVMPEELPIPTPEVAYPRNSYTAFGAFNPLSNNTDYRRDRGGYRPPPEDNPPGDDPPDDPPPTVPEPTTLVILGLGLAGIVIARKRQR